VPCWYTQTHLFSEFLFGIQSLYTGRENLVQRRSHLVCLSLLIFAAGLSNARAALIEHNLVVEPNFTHDAGKSSSFVTSSYLDVVLPEITLAPGDLLRITVEFTGDRYLKLVPTPVGGWQDFYTELIMQTSGPLAGTTGYGDDATHTAQIFDVGLNLLHEEILPASYFIGQTAPRLRRLSMNLSRHLYDGDPIDQTFRKWLYEIEMPTSITLASGGTIPYSTTTFTNSVMRIVHLVHAESDEGQVPVAVYVVPEPGTLSLLIALTIAAVCFRRF
jgi:hypothetical protein